MSIGIILCFERKITLVWSEGQIHGHSDSWRRCAFAFEPPELEQRAKCSVGIGPEISESVKNIYDAAGVRVFRL